jgi:hypothetical protein
MFICHEIETIMRKIFFVLVIIGTLSVQAQKKTPISGKENLIGGLKKELSKKYNYQNVDVYVLAGRLNIDIKDIHVKAMPKNIREIKSKEIADFARSFFDKSPEGKKMSSEVSKIGVNHLNKSGGGALTSPSNTYERYVF